MKIHLLSDLHLEFCEITEDLSSIESDVVVLAGDISTGAKGIAWAAMIWQDRPVLYVPGNHEYYGRRYSQHRRTMREVADQYDNIHLLDRGVVVIDETMFVGATLWTDFEYWGKGDLVRKASAMAAGSRYLNDFRLITISDEADDEGRRFMPEDSVQLHKIELEFLQYHLFRKPELLATEFGVERIRKRVVVTHHLPSCKSVHTRYADSELTPAFASHLDEAVAQSDLWLHGHTHDSIDYHVERKDGHVSRVVCNPRGYSRDKSGNENVLFDPAFVVEI